MPKTLIRKINLGFGAALLILLVIGISSYRAIHSMMRSAEQALHTEDVITRTTQLGSLIAGAESSQRGYILTQDPAYLRPYEAAAASLRAQVDSLRSLMRNMPRQEERLQRLDTLVRTRLAMMGEGVRLRDAQGLSAAQKWLGSTEGRRLTEEIRILLAEIKRDEESVSRRQADAARASATTAVLLLIIGGMAAIVVVFVFSSFLRRDVQKRVTAEDELRQARDLLEERVRERTAELETVIEASPLAIMAIDAKGHVALWNSTAERLLGWTREEMIGRPYRPAHPEDEASFQEVAAMVAAGKPIIGLEVTRRRKDGTPVDLALYSAPLRGPSGESLGLIGMAADLSETKQLEERLRQSQKMESIGKLAGGIAHDFNNLLTAITGYTDLLYLRLPGDIGKRELSEIRKSADRAASLTRQLLAFSRQQVLQPKVVEVNEVVANLGSMLGRIIGEHIELRTRLDPQVGRVKVDPFQLEQVIVNLAVNARDAMPRGGKLTIETGNKELDEAYTRTRPDVAPGPYVMIAVSDTGVGMDAETRQRIFEPFFTTKDVGKGTGLGLSTVYGIVRQSRGDMWVYSEPGQGATFKIYLPRVEEAADTLGAPAPPPANQRGSETILVVEDEEALLHLVSEILKDAGYHVLTAKGPNEALRLIRENRGPIDLLLTDVVMPGMSGRVLAERVTADRPGIRVLYMSGYTDNAIVHHGVLEPGLTYIQKPFTPNTLTKKVREVLDSAEVTT